MRQRLHFHSSAPEVTVQLDTVWIDNVAISDVKVAEAFVGHQPEQFIDRLHQLLRLGVEHDQGSTS